jgi:hypothetical protein
MSNYDENQAWELALEEHRENYGHSQEAMQTRAVFATVRETIRDSDYIPGWMYWMNAGVCARPFDQEID